MRDSGTYECMADNSQGTSVDIVKINVQPKNDVEFKFPKATILKTEDNRLLREG